MSDWRRILAEVATDVEGHFDALSRRLFDRLDCDKPLLIVPYIGFANADTLFLRGRVLRDKGITSAAENDTIWENLLNMYRRFNSHEIAGARLRLHLDGWQQDLISDEEGYFYVEHPLESPLPGEGYWREVEVELLACPDEMLTEPVKARGRVLVPPPDAQFAVISDIDDTVLKTDVLNYLKMARNVFLHNSRTRLPFEGVAAFYQALQQGTPASFNPIFYLSKSPWNLYDLLVDFFNVREIPLGPFFLIDMGIAPDKLLMPDTREYKLKYIELLLEGYPHLPFMLIGDSGELDPDIYVEAAETHPGRVLAIYIRDVTGPYRDESLKRLAERAQQAGTELLLLEDTGAAAAHALQKGWIEAEAYPDVLEERAEDHKPPLPVEALLDPESGD